MVHGVLGMGRHECNMLLGKPYGNWLLGRQEGVKKQCANIIYMSVFRVG
jgi:hypothetical protein